LLFDDLDMPPLPSSVLVVDDDPITLELISGLLGGIGIADIDTAADGAEGVHILQTVQYDLIIADWHMNPLGGLDFLRLVRQDKRFDSVPFVMITSDKHPELERFAWESGADAFLRKPFDIVALRQTIDRAMQRDPAEVRTWRPGGGMVLDLTAARRARSG
jgi:CheY-like chemotaxis protein